MATTKFKKIKIVWQEILQKLNRGYGWREYKSYQTAEKQIKIYDELWLNLGMENVVFKP